MLEACTDATKTKVAQEKRHIAQKAAATWNCSLCKRVLIFL
jgi:hypothetical protein